MRKQYILTFFLLVFIFSSCSKSLEDRLTGSWEIKRAWKQRFLDRDYFQTGYEGGTFTFNENGDASFVKGADTMTGFWRSDRYTDYWYNSGSGRNESRTMKYLRINLVNYRQNIRLEWDFDDFHFKDSWHEIKAEQYSLSNDRIYEFERK